MTQPVDVELNLNGDYVQQVDQATTVTEGLSSALNAVQAPARGVQQALNAATPSRVHLAAWGGFTAAAAYWQEQTGGVRATASAAGQSMRVLEGDVRRLAGSFPIGTAGAVALVQAVQGLGAQQSRILPLARTFERISAATNTFGPEIAQNFGQLNRAMASLDPARVARFGDVLTTLSARTGASAMGMITFAQAISPVAQQAGIGESAVLGISAAFTKLGDDGGAAATAVNKILSDLNRSVREGSNDMAAYAQITGMTVQQFKALYQANPAQALAQVTTAIGHAGPRGQMELESLGLEGVRTQRALLQLSQSGGLQSTVNQAIGSYGNGSTQKAAEAALGGLNSSLTELRSTAGNTADALGGPFLHVLTRITDIAKTGLAPVNAVLGSGVGQAGILGFGALAATGLVARRLVRPLGMGALATQAATSGPLRSLAGGYAIGRVGQDAAMAGATEGMVAGRFGRQAIAMQMLGQPYGRSFMQPINTGFLRAGAILGQARSDLAGGTLGAQGMGPAIGGPGLRGALLRGARVGIGLSSGAYEAWMRSYADPLHQAVTPAGDRVSMLQPRPGGLFSQAGEIRQQAGMRAALGFLEKEGTGTARALSRMASATGGATRALFTFGTRAGGAGLAAGGSALRGALGGALGLVGGIGGAALLGGGLLYSAYRGSQQANAAERDRVGNLDMYSVLNSYRDAMGQAGQAAVTLADQMQQAAVTIGNSVTTMDQARSVSSQDIAAAGPPNKKKAQHIYRGSATDIAGQIGALNLQGLSPQDVQGVKMDLLKQGIRPDEIDQVLSLVSKNNNQGGVASSSTISGLIGGVAAASASYSPSFIESEKRNPLGAHAMSNWRLIGSGGVGSKPLVGDDGKKTLDLLQNSIMQQYADLTGHFSQGYSIQQTIRTANSALQDALKTGDPDTVAAVAQRLGIAVTGNTKFHVSAQAVRDAGGDITKLVGKNQIYGQSAAQLQQMGVTTTGAGVAGTRINTGDYTALQSAGSTALLPFFASTAPKGAAGAAYRAVTASSAQQSDISLQTHAVNLMIDSAQKAGISLTDLAEQATKATSTTAGWEQALMAATAQEANYRRSVALQGATRGQSLTANTAADLKALAAGPGVDPNGFQAKQYQQAKDDLAGQRANVVQYYQQRIMAQYQYQIQVQRAQQDYQRTSSRSEQDYLIGRQRAWRDYNINVARQVQDAAAQMYNPYQRIQVAPVWDVFNLMVNRGTQLTQLRQQLANIRRLRELGVTQETIDQLRLYDPANAQQLSVLVHDLEGSRSAVGSLNRQSSAIQRASGSLLSQSPDFRRQKNDFLRNLRDQQTDFNRQQDRARQDYLLALSRMAQDLHMQDLEITNDMTSLTGDMNKILHGQFVDLHGQITNSLSDTLAAAKHFMPLIESTINTGSVSLTGSSGSGTTSSGVTATGSVHGGGYGNAPVVSNSYSDTINPRTGKPVRSSSQTTSYVAPGTGTLYTGPTTDEEMPSAAFQKAHPADPHYNQSIAAQMKPSWWKNSKIRKAWVDLWNEESNWSQYSHNSQDPSNVGQGAYGIPQAYPGRKMKAAGRDWETNPATQIKWGIDYIAHTYGDPLKAAQRTGLYSGNYVGYAAGGIATGPHVGVVAEGGRPEAMIPLNSQGLEFMVAALRQYVDPASAKLIGSGGLAHAVHIDRAEYNYDQGYHVHGDVKVTAGSPDEWMRQSRAAERTKNLTATRSVRYPS